MNGFEVIKLNESGKLRFQQLLQVPRKVEAQHRHPLAAALFWSAVEGV